MAPTNCNVRSFHVDETVVRIWLLWVVPSFPPPRSSSMTVVVPFVHDDNELSPTRRRRRWIDCAAGLAFLATTTAMTIYYMTCLTPWIQNDYFWTSFNATGAQTFVADVYNSQLWNMTSRDHPLGLFTVDAASTKDYSHPDTVITIPASAARRIVVEQLNILSVAVAGLRSQSTVHTVNAVTSYCWVDFDQAWEVAHTAARQERCYGRYSHNGNVYMEAMLRNTDWMAWYTQWGTLFEVTYGSAVRESSRGLAWLDQTTTAVHSFSVADEIQYWTSYNITQYILPWHNRNVGGLDNVVELHNALQTFPILVNSVAYTDTPGSWTTVVASFGVWNDVGYASYVNASLVRNASNSFTLLGVENDPEMWIGVYPATTCSLLFHDTIGALGAVDLLYIMPPPSLVDVFLTTQSLLNTAARVYPQLHVPSSSMALELTPPQWQRDGIAYYSGNPLCLDDMTQPYIQQSFGFDDACTDPRPPMTIDATMANAVVAMWFTAMQQANASIMPSTICAWNRNPRSLCHAFLSAAESLLATWSTMPAFPNPYFSSSILADTLALDVGLMQYATIDGSPLVLQQPLLDLDDPAWSFYGWLHVLDWLQGTREVVSFQGDVSAIALVSKQYTPRSFQSDPLQIPTRFCHVIDLLLWYMNGVLAAVLVGSSISALFRRGHHVGSNLFFCHPVVGVVWMGRPLLLLRGMVAMATLSTAKIHLIQMDGLTSFDVPPRTVAEAVVTSGETLWLTFALCDMLLLLTVGRSKRFVVASCGSVWFMNLVLELAFPFRPSATVGRTCSSPNLDIQLTCVSGRIDIGSYERFVLLSIVQCVCIMTSFCFTQCWCSSSNEASTTLPVVVPAIALHLFDLEPETPRFDAPTDVLCGIVPVCLFQHQYKFCVTSWALIPMHAYNELHVTRAPMEPIGASSPLAIQTNGFASMVFQANGSLPMAFQGNRVALLTFLSGITSTKKSRTYQMLRTAASIVFLVLSAISSALFFYLLQDQLSNDFLWAGFNSTGMQPFLIDWYNRELYFRPNTMQLSMANASVLQNYNTTSAIVQYSKCYATTMHFEDLDLPTVIQGLRSMDVRQLPWIATQYCWVDFTRRWDMANTNRRQRRCAENMLTNGAVYVEALVRNVHLGDFMAGWGSALTFGIFNELQTSNDGRAWMTSLSSPRLSIGDEAELWTAVNITRFDVQWQNYKSLGVVETFDIKSAFGSTYPVTMKASTGAYRFALETSFKMYWGWGSDLWAIDQNGTLIAHMSLIRSSGTFAFANHTIQDLLIQNQTLQSPLDAGLAMVAATIGPFGSIDLVHIPCPASLIELYHRFSADVTLILNSNPDAQSLLVGATVGLTPGPATWFADYALTLGGSFLCPVVSASISFASGPLAYIRHDLSCDVTLTENLSINPQPSALALLAWGAFMCSGTCPTIHDVCNLASAIGTAGICEDALLPAQTWVSTFMSPVSQSRFYQDAAAVQAEITAMDIEIFQYGQQSPASPIEFLHMNVLAPADPYFRLFGWLYMIDWVLGVREVLSVRGDVSTMTTISGEIAYGSTTPKASEIPSNVAYYCQLCMQYTTSMVFLVTFFTLVYIVHCRGLIEGFNMFKINRMGGIVWVGRPLLTLRSVVAISFLATANVQLVVQIALTKLTTPAQQTMMQRISTLLAGSEASWLVIVLTDTAMLVTTHHTNAYSNKAMGLAIATAICISTTWPVQPSFTIRRTCSSVQLDFQLTCQAGVVEIGSHRRVIELMAVTAAIVVLCFAWEKWRHPSFRLPQHRLSLLLPAGAHFLYAKKAWIFNEVLYVDQASAFLCGLVTVTYHKSVYILDVKTWRTHSIPIEASLAHLASHKFDQQRVGAAIPLVM
ncbi:Aste57867_3278 [Aphanomyces stellatus]|uniref:Aste57867_3278 protein n=1 Tax=Aphanomyces stellatus TaxID=120398 RepID=A0A485KB30_9STRA|nr:hypothetical protein As57867_003268 [Aphanomyces stellatus]VFT80450.1 Aste57867_3278 [Aphanomyces stellatus]